MGNSSLTAVLWLGLDFEVGAGLGANALDGEPCRTAVANFWTGAFLTDLAGAVRCRPEVSEESPPEPPSAIARNRSPICRSISACADISSLAAALSSAPEA